MPRDPMTSNPSLKWLPKFKGTGLTDAVRENVIQNAWDLWQMQREQDSHTKDHGGYGPVCTVIKKIKDSQLAPYLDNKTQEQIIENIPVLSKPIRYRNEFGKVVVDNNSMYLIFLGDAADPNNPTFGPVFTFLTKNDVIEFEGMKWSIDEIDHDPISMLTQVELLLVSGSTDGDTFLGKT